MALGGGSPSVGMLTISGSLADSPGVIGILLSLPLGSVSLGCLSLVVAPAEMTPQIIPSNSGAVIVGKATKDGKLQPASLGLGNGGVRAVRIRTARSRVGLEPKVVPGEQRTLGGVLVRVKSAGVKLDFPSGRELLISPDGRIHLRSGEKTLPFFRGVRLILGDGTIITVRRGANSRFPLASVEVIIRGRVRRLWSGTRRVVNASHSGVFVGTTLLALGDGGTLFKASAAGLLVGLERVLCPKNSMQRTPRRRLVILGGLLAESLAKLPSHAPQRSAQFPQVKEAALRFAALGYLFRGMTARPPGAVGELWFQLRHEYRLKVESTQNGILVIGLYRGAAPIPGVEWTISGKTEIHFVRPVGGTRGGPRYFLRGIDLGKSIKSLLPDRETCANRAQVNRVVAALGGSRPRTLKVKRR